MVLIRPLLIFDSSTPIQCATCVLCPRHSLSRPSSCIEVQGVRPPIKSVYSLCHVLACPVFKARSITAIFKSKPEYLIVLARAHTKSAVCAPSGTPMEISKAKVICPEDVTTQSKQEMKAVVIVYNYSIS
ncbi:uncharacterized protein RAG0_05142 [Rhynchosporium agropyri]|uniref:Uncharacterized protein n=1 Tax=Rhynchosporium agropyri TaxID=914238 RepID=A0A1E1KBV6_9HELO|nr:uncharacterized protein RAG0_05142 [Rhynchosporium agropyri]